ncbi:hypothetical protein EVAR_40015_1 [Eumeta japonica]|uniref:Uncharacterized protein n=1 Tax=Eumeta variegata TaxID=151549 RepID=A0A4C1YR15_EUMVA|nr:hypothetical protein EVAR_40015_1 [Eumeta japonica]
MVWEPFIRPVAQVRHRLSRFEWSEPSGPTYFVVQGTIGVGRGPAKVVRDRYLYCRFYATHHGSGCGRVRYSRGEVEEGRKLTRQREIGAAMGKRGRGIPLGGVWST